MPSSYVPSLRRAAFKSFVIFVISLIVIAQPLMAQSPHLIKDINASQDVGSSMPTSFVQVGSKTFFLSSVPGEGYQLWKTDGTAAGTALVTSRYFESASQMTSSNGRLFFVVSSSGLMLSSWSSTTGDFSIGMRAGELWTSDGTPEGTILLNDKTYSGITSINSNASPLTDVSGTLFFIGDNGSGGMALWKTDGTTAGSVIVKDFGGSGDMFAASTIPVALTSHNGSLFFVTSGSQSWNLWKTDGTQSGTVVVKSVATIVTPGLLIGNSCSPSNLTSTNTTLVFTACNAAGLGGTPMVALWTSDGTDAGTTAVKDLYASGDASATEFTNVNGSVFFRLTYSSTGYATDLWKSDGTAAGTALVTSMCTESCNDINTYGPSYLTNLGGTLFYAAQGGLWKSDGTAVGTVEVASGLMPKYLAVMNGELYFQGTNSTNGAEVWKSDGTAAGTAMVKDICPGACSSLWPTVTLARSTGIAGVPVPIGPIADSPFGNFLLGPAPGYIVGGISSYSYLPRVLFPSNGKLYFMACEPVNQCEPWTSDGTESGTTLLKNLVLNTSSRILSAADLKGTLLFPAFDGTSITLWKSDGAEAGTAVLSNKVQPSFGYSAVVNGTMFFLGFDTAHGYELWKTDGTDTGTVLVKDINPGTTGSIPSMMTNVNGTVFFVANDGTHGYELWKSDGTEAGTVMVKDIDPSDTTTSYASVDNLINLNGTLVFAANDGTTVGLWKSDGTEGGTVKIADLTPNSNCTGTSTTPCLSSFLPGNFVNVNGTLFFTTSTGTLWKSDGTANGTVAVSADATFSRASNLTNVNGTLYFITSGILGPIYTVPPTYRDALCKSDGTASGTVVVKDFSAARTTPYSGGLVSGTLSSLILGNLTNANGTLFFTAPDSANGIALWKSDGTTDGTVMVKDVPASGLASVDGTLYFASKDANGTELWKSDGSSDGTVMVADINAGANGSFPRLLATSHGRLFFTANDGTHGTELWALTVAPTTVNLTSSANPTVVGKSVTLTASLTSMVPGAFTGTMQFMDGTTAIGSVPVNSSGVASLATTSLIAGTHSITAVYGGDVQFPDGTSSVLNQVVLTSAPDYTLSANPTSATIHAGQSATFVITATADQYFNGTITFGCGTLPTGVSCTFSPATLSPISGSPLQTTLTVTTRAKTSAALMQPALQTPATRAAGLWASLGSVGVFGLLLVGGSTKRRRIALAVLALTLLAISLTACGGGSTHTDPNATPIGSSTVQVTATATAGTVGANTAAHQLAITINVQ